MIKDENQALQLSKLVNIADALLSKPGLSKDCAKHVKGAILWGISELEEYWTILRKADGLKIH